MSTSGHDEFSSPQNAFVHCWQCCNCELRVDASLEVLLAVLPVCLLDASGSYFRFGPSSDFILVGVPIDTVTKYSVTLALIAIVNIIKVISDEIGGPIIGYNPDKKVITEFTKWELQLVHVTLYWGIYGNAMYALGGVRGLFMTLISVTQFDIALWSLFISEAASVFTIRMLLDEKTFTPYAELETVEISYAELVK